MNKNEIVEIKKLLSSYPKDLIPHLFSDLGLRRYIEKADRIKRVMPSGRILDWGCGMGQMSYLLKRRDLDVVSYEISSVDSPLLKEIGQKIILANDPVKLPFPDSSFDAVLSSGVLEHVEDRSGSLREIHRILKKDGYFFVFMLPNKYSYIEFISDLMGRGDHLVKFSQSGIRRLLGNSGFEIAEIGYRGFLPYNLKGFPSIVGEIYHKFDAIIEKVDLLLSGLPGINILSTNIEVVSCKIPDACGAGVAEENFLWGKVN